MRETLGRLLEQADLALGSCRGVIPEERLAGLIEAVSAVRARLAYPEEVAVVALAGGTGSGKSSLLNALVGDEVADTGGVRPTTSAPLAAVPAAHGEGVERYLDLIGVSRRHHYAGRGFCLLDLPDTDSVEVEHRHRVDALLSRVDVVVWVVDPEKYRDARLHRDYLRLLARYAAQFVFALNQVDRLGPEDEEQVMADLTDALAEDGIDQPELVRVAAAPRFGPPFGLEELAAAITGRLQDGRGIHEKLLVDLEVTSRALSEEAGTGLDFDRRAGEALRGAALDLAEGDDRAAIRSLVGFVDSLAEQAGGLVAERLARLAAAIPAHVLRIAGETKPDAESRGWRPWRRRSRVAPQPRPAEELLDEAVIRPARALLAPRAVAVADVMALAVEVARARAETPR